MQKLLDIVDILKFFIENLKMYLGCVWDNLIFLDKNLFNSGQVCAYCTYSNSTPSVNKIKIVKESKERLIPLST